MVERLNDYLRGELRHRHQSLTLAARMMFKFHGRVKTEGAVAAACSNLVRPAQSSHTWGKSFKYVHSHPKPRRKGIEVHTEWMCSKCLQIGLGRRLIPSAFRNPLTRAPGFIYAWLLQPSKRAGRKRMVSISANMARTMRPKSRKTMPINQKGNNISQKNGRMTSATSANGQHKTNNMHQSRNSISALTTPSVSQTLEKSSSPQGKLAL